MIKFRAVVATAPVYSWWDNNRNQIAFCRGTRGFIAFNNEPYELKMKLFTCLPSGVYCDAITGELVDGQCTGTRVVVDENGEANIQVPSDIGVLAIHIGVKIPRKIQTNAELISDAIYFVILLTTQRSFWSCHLTPFSLNLCMLGYVFSFGSYVLGGCCFSDQIFSHCQY